jgi:YjbE family integral membrane protein
MELFSSAWWMALATIIAIDLVLAGDNALVIGIAASRLRPDLRRKAIVFGAMGAIAVRTALTLVVVWLLKIPGLLLIGGLLLLPIAYKLAVPSEDGGGHEHAAADSFWGAMKTIIIADALMGVDNVLAIGGAAHGRWDLVIIGLLVTIPLVVWGSGFVTKMMDRWPLVAAIGASILALTGAGMIVKDPLFDRFVLDHVFVDRALQAAAALTMFTLGYRALKRGGPSHAAATSSS